MAPTDGISNGKPFAYHESSYAALVVELFENAFYNIIHDTVLESHRTEKISRMNSAAVQAVNAAHSVTSTTVDGPVLTPAGSAPKNAVQVQQLPQVKTTIPAATYDHGRVYLTGNPLKTVGEIFCPQCRLPRLPYPLKGVGSRAPDLSTHTHWCNLHPFIRLHGHDVYGNSFPTEQAKTKKERELQKQQAKAERDAANRQAAAEEGDSAAAALARLTAESGKPANYIPWHTCPNCKRSLLITRFAQHLEKCLGIAGRTCSRTAMNRISAASGGRNTPSDSRAASPVVSSRKSGGGGAAAADDEDGSNGKTGKKNGSALSNGANSAAGDDEDAKPIKRKKTVHLKRERDRTSGAGTDKEGLKIKLKSAQTRTTDSAGLNGSSGAGIHASRTASPLSGSTTTSTPTTSTGTGPNAGGASTYSSSRNTAGSKASSESQQSKRDRERDDSIVSSDLPRKKMKLTGKDSNSRDRDHHHARNHHSSVKDSSGRDHSRDRDSK